MIFKQVFHQKMLDAAGDFSANHPIYEVGALVRTDDYLESELNNPWFCSINGVSPAAAQQLQSGLTKDAIKTGISVLRQHGKDYKVDYNPRTSPLIYGDVTGKNSTLSFDPDSTSTDVLNVTALQPTVLSINQIKTGTTNPDVNYNGDQAKAQKTAYSGINFDSNGQPIPLSGKIGGESNAPLDPFGGGAQVQSDLGVTITDPSNLNSTKNNSSKSSGPNYTVPDENGVQKPIADTGTSINKTSIRTGTVLVPDSAIKKHTYINYPK